MKTLWDNSWPALFVLAFVGVLVGAPGYFIFRAENAREARATAAEQACGMYPGDIVEAAIDARRGMVTRIYGGDVWVRFAQPNERTDVSLLGADGSIAIAPYSTVRMACFELREVQSSVE